MYVFIIESQLLGRWMIQISFSLSLFPFRLRSNPRFTYKEGWFFSHEVQNHAGEWRARNILDKILDHCKSESLARNKVEMYLKDCYGVILVTSAGLWQPFVCLYTHNLFLCSEFNCTHNQWYDARITLFLLAVIFKLFSTGGRTSS
jgi:hypothetical protein